LLARRSADDIASLPLQQVVVAIIFATLLSAADGRVIRSNSAKAQFKAAHPCPATDRHSGACPGYVIDHVVPLACRGADSADNMQWQTIAAGKAKDRWERDCYLWRD